MSQLEKLIAKFETDELFRRVCCGNPTWAEMIAAAILEDRTGKDYVMAAHNAASIDLVAGDGQHVQVKTLNTPGSLATIYSGRDLASLVVAITTFGDRPRFYLLPMATFKSLANVYDTVGRAIRDGSAPGRWEIAGGKIKNGLLAAFDITPAVAVPLVAA